MKFVLKILGNRKLNLDRIPKMFVYPKARRDEIFDNFFGTKIQDTYRWLEDPDGQDTKNFVDHQNAIADNYLNSCPYRELIKGKIVDMLDYPRSSVPKFHGNLYFQLRNSGLDDQDVLYVCEKLGEDGEVLIDPNKFTGIEDYQIQSNNLAVMLESGEIRFCGILNGEDHQEVLKNAFLISWSPDGQGIFYTTSGKLFYHKLGTQQVEDLVMVDFGDDVQIKAVTSDCSKYLVVFLSKNFDGNKVYLVKLPKLEFRPLVDNFDANFKYLTNNGSQFLFLTNKGAPNYQIISIDIKNPNEDNWKIFVPEEEKKILQWGQPIDKDKLILCYMKDFRQFLQLHDISSGQKLHDIQIDIGTIDSTSGKRSDSQFFYSLTSLFQPPKICKIQFENDEILNETIQETKLNTEDLEMKQIFYKSKDGSNIPMFLLHNSNLKLNGKNPCLLHGYGGFGHSLLPKFNLGWLIFARHFRGIVAIANIRGGGEYGIKWHSSAKLEKKQTSIDDFEYAAHYLVGCGYTSPDKLTIEGEEHGGLLTTACANQSPNLYKAIISHNGILDMLRYHKFPTGLQWKSEFGTSEDEFMFQHLLKYSPLHNITAPKSGQYPATLLLTGVNDKVPSLHALKFIAQLQHEVGACESQKNPLLVKIEEDSGTRQDIDRLTNVFCFISNVLNIPFYE